MQRPLCSRSALWYLLSFSLLARARAQPQAPPQAPPQAQAQAQASQCRPLNENLLDSGGDPCSYYSQHPQHCGCCDTPLFTAASDCCECKGPHTSGNTISWESFLLTWPHKATALQFDGLIDSELPADIAERWPNLTTINLGSSRLRGSLPPGLGKLTALTELQLSNNHLSGSLPPELGQLTALRVLEAENNQLTGSLPPELGQLTALRSLGLKDNQLSGSLPRELGQLTALIRLDLRVNSLSGSLPPEFGRLRSVVSLQLANNRLSGSLPAELGNITALVQMDLALNQLSGSLPPEIGNLRGLSWVDLARNRLSGNLPPELGRLGALVMLRLGYNQFRGGLPASFAGLQRLKEFNAARNPNFCGNASVLEELDSLLALNLADCCFQEQHLPSLPSNLERLDLRGNRLSSLPARWQVQGRSLKAVLLNRNRISQWIPVCPSVLSIPGFLAWLQLERLEVSSNPLSLPVFDFLQSLSHLAHLNELRAHDANLTGPVPSITSHVFTPLCPFLPASFLPTGPTFLALVMLDLSGNAITALSAVPPPRLVQADLSNNALADLNTAWWRASPLYALDVSGNPKLRLPVLLEPSALCPEAGASEVIANPNGWSRTVDGGSECTTVCRMERTLFQTDPSINTSILCRCAQGRGVGLDCLPCPEDTYSSLSFENGHYTRSCLACPADSTLTGGWGMCFAQCSCAAGHYMVQLQNGSALDVGTTPCSRLAPEGRCLSCGLFKTSLPGSRKASECFCNSNESDGRGWKGLLERQGRCGCPEGSYMDFASRSCTPCQLEEECGDWTQSLAPPKVKPGFWAQPPPSEGSDGMFGNFSRHSIWRCQNVKTCIGDSRCGENRTGTACSLCRQGHFLTPAGSCAPCSQSHKEARVLLAVLILACMVIPIAAHFQLRSGEGEPHGLALSLRSVRVSLKQLLRFAQILGLISLFRVEWPPDAENVFAVTRAFSLGFATWAGVACLDARQEQTMTLELAFRWVMPLVGVVITCLAAVLTNICGLVLGALCARFRPQSEARVRQLLSFQAMDVLRILVFFLNLFFPSLLKNALLPLTCTPSPNGFLTMNSFPHTRCWSASADGDESFWRVAIPGLAQVVLLSFGFPLLLFFAWRRIETIGTTAATKRQTWLEQRKRWWAFLFSDFRQRKMYWALVAVCKNIVLNLIVVFLPGFGTAQLLLAAVVSIAYACWAYRASPYPDLSNSLLETCTASSVAALCIFSAGVGFQSEPDILDVGAVVAAGRYGSGYLQRTAALLSVQALSLLGPAAIVLFQLLVAVPGSQRCLPRSLQPWTAAQREEWSERFTRVMRIGGGPLARVVAEFDTVDFTTFRRAVAHATVQKKSMSRLQSTWTSKVEEEQQLQQVEQQQEQQQQQQQEQQEQQQGSTEKEDVERLPDALRMENENRALREENAALKEAFHQREQALQMEIQQLRRKVSRVRL